MLWTETPTKNGTKFELTPLGMVVFFPVWFPAYIVMMVGLCIFTIAVFLVTVVKEHT